MRVFFPVNINQICKRYSEIYAYMHVDGVGGDVQHNNVIEEDCAISGH